METAIFKNRREAGRQLTTALFKRGYKGKNTLVIGIPRGGLVVADEVAKALSATLDVVIARKLRAPYQPELGIGAVVDGDHIVLNEEVVRSVGASQNYLNREIAYQKEEVERRLRFYRDGRPNPEVAGKTVIVVDDGIATGYTFRASLESLRQRLPDRLVAAAPVASRDSSEMLKAFADEVVCLHTPVSFFAVGAWYENFGQISDEEAAAILRRNWSTLPLAA
ncbi:MAG: phosphoribosyltransferase [Thermodesulfobacteriota bacterium]